MNYFVYAVEFKCEGLGHHKEKHVLVHLNVTDSTFIY